MKRDLNPAGNASNSSTFSRETVILLFCIILSHWGEASPLGRPRQNNWFVSGHTGIAIRSPGVTTDLRFKDDGFRHHAGFAWDLGVGRTFENRWESALRWNAYTLFGQSSLPHYSSAGYYIAYPGFLEQEKLEYVTQGNTFSFVLRFLFGDGRYNSRSPASIRPFIEAGWGINNYVTEVRYSQIPAGVSKALIFRNRNGENANGTAQLSAGLGLKIGTPGAWNAEILMNAEWVEFTTLNPVSQMTNPVESSSRALVSKITAGLVIPFKITVRRDTYLPFRW